MKNLSKSKIRVTGWMLGFLTTLPLTLMAQGGGRVPSAEQALTRELSAALLEAAQKQHLNLDLAGLVYVGQRGTLVANVGVSGVERLRLEDLARGADVFFFHLATNHKSAVPPGFYKVRLSREAQSQTPMSQRAINTGGWQAKLIDDTGKVVATRSAQVGSGEETQRIRWTAGFGECGFYIDAHWSSITVTVCIGVD